MLVRECYTEIRTGEDGKPYQFSGERMVEMPDILSEAEAKAASEAVAIDVWNQSIRDQLAANDTRYGVRAITEAMAGDSTRLDWLKAEQAKLRAQFQGVSDLTAPPEPTGHAAS